MTIDRNESKSAGDLPKAEIVQFRLSSYLNQADLPKLGIWRWIQYDAGLSAQQIGAALQDALNGQLWMIAPYRIFCL